MSSPALASQHESDLLVKGIVRSWYRHVSFIRTRHVFRKVPYEGSTSKLQINSKLGFTQAFVCTDILNSAFLSKSFNNGDQVAFYCFRFFPPFCLVYTSFSKSVLIIMRQKYTYLLTLFLHKLFIVPTTGVCINGAQLHEYRLVPETHVHVGGVSYQ